MILKTQRLLLRPWNEDDAKYLYKYGKNPDVALNAGFKPYTSVEECLEIIKNVLTKKNIFAIVLRETNEAIGSIALMIGKDSDLAKSDKEGEIGFWIAEEYWGEALTPEASKEIIRYAFEELKLKVLWCSYINYNTQSLSVQKKCGFRYNYSEKNKFFPTMEDFFTEHITKLTIRKWKKQNNIGRINL